MKPKLALLGVAALAVLGIVALSKPSSASPAPDPQPNPPDPQPDVPPGPFPTPTPIDPDVPPRPNPFPDPPPFPSPGGCEAPPALLHRAEIMVAQAGVPLTRALLDPNEMEGVADQLDGYGCAAQANALRAVAYSVRLSNKLPTNPF